MGKVRISELPALTTGSAETELVGNYRGKTYRISLSEITASIVQMLSESVDNRLDLLEQFEADYNQMSASFLSIEQLNAYTESANTRLDNLEIISQSYLDFTQSYNTDSASFDERIIAATNEQDLSYLVTTSSFNEFTQSQNQLNATWATTGSNTFSGSQTISGSLIPAVGDGETTSSFSLGAPEAAWKDIWVSKGTIHFLDDTGSIVDTISAISGGIAVSNLIVSGSMTGSLDYIHLINSPEFPTTGSNTFYGNQKSYGTVAANAMMNPQDLIEPTIIPSGYNGLLIGPVGTNTEIIVQDNALLVIL